MYGIFTYIWDIYGVNVSKYAIHGSSGLVCTTMSAHVDYVSASLPEDLFFNQGARRWGGSQQLAEPCALAEPFGSSRIYLCMIIKIEKALKTSRKHHRACLDSASCLLDKVAFHLSLPPLKGRSDFQASPNLAFSILCHVRPSICPNFKTTAMACAIKN